MSESVSGFVTYDEQKQCFEIFGVRYAVDLFRGLGIAPVGTVFRIAAREDGIVTLQTVAAPPSKERDKPWKLSDSADPLEGM